LPVLAEPVTSVMWYFKNQADGNDKEINIELAAEKVMGLKDLVDVIQFIEVGINVNEADYQAYEAVLCYNHNGTAL